MIKQIKSERVVSLEDLDRQLVNRQSGTKPIPLENLGDGFRAGETVEVTQSRNYQGKNVEKNAG